MRKHRLSVEQHHPEEGSGGSFFVLMFKEKLQATTEFHDGDVNELPFAEFLPPFRKKWLEKEGVRFSVPEGRNIIQEGRPRNGLYVLLSGKVKLSKEGTEGEHPIIFLLGQGATLGHGDGDRYFYSVETLESCELFHLKEKVLKELALAVPDLSLELYRQSLSYFRRIMEKLVFLTDASVKEKVVRALWELESHYAVEEDDGQIRIEAPLTRKELGALAGTNHQQVVRVLKGLEQEELLKKEEGRILFPDPEAWERMKKQVSTPSPEPNAHE